MMLTIVKEGLVSFKELEQKIFTSVCESGREMTQGVWNLVQKLGERIDEEEKEKP